MIQFDFDVRLYTGLSTDVKPTDAPVGSRFTERDTGKTFITNDGSTWGELKTSLTAGTSLLGKVGIDQTTPGITNAVAPISGQAGVDGGSGAVSAKTQRVTLATDVALPPAGKSSSVSAARPNDTTAYTAGDVVGASTGAAGAVITFTGLTAGEFVITGASLEVDVASVPSGMTTFRLYLYNVTPPSALGDNAAWDLPSGDRASFLGYIDLGAPVDLGSTIYVEQNSVNKQITLASTSLFGYLVTTAGYTPTAQAVKVVTIHGVSV